MTTETKKTRRVKITWVERGTDNAACLGLDETVEVEAADGVDLITAVLQAEADAEYHGECRGIDTEKYAAEAELLDD
jgi:hypothetical protein